MAHVITDIRHIQHFRLKVLHKALRLELLGMKRRGRSTYSIIKSEFGFRGSRESVYIQFGRYIDENIPA